MIRNHSRGGTNSKFPERTDNSILYEELGNIVIERADAGDIYCREIFLQAYKKATEDISENNHLLKEIGRSAAK